MIGQTPPIVKCAPGATGMSPFSRSTPYSLHMLAMEGNLNSKSRMLEISKNTSCPFVFLDRFCGPQYDVVLSLPLHEHPSSVFDPID